MFFLSRFYISIIIIAVIFLSCNKNILSPAAPVHLEITISDNISLKQDEIAQILNEKIEHIKIPGDLRIELLVYSYSSGKEIFSYSGKNPNSIENTVSIGYIKCMIKTKSKGERLEDVKFIETVGYSKDEMIQKLSSLVVDFLKKL
jgi:hypothetical protein